MPTKKLTKKQLDLEYKKLRDADNQKKRKQELYDAKEWYTIRALLGNQ